MFCKKTSRSESNMKKTFVILTIVLAILAAPVFAEVTASGEVNFGWAFNADDYSEKVDTNDMVLDLGGTVGDYTSISAEFEAEYEDVDGELADGSGDSTVSMNQATLTQDITGALAIDAPATVSVTFGIAGIGADPVNYNEVAGYGDFCSDGGLDPGTLMTKVSLGVDAFTIDAAMFEGNNFGVNAYGNVADMADVSVYYFNEATAGWKALGDITPVEPSVLGFNAGVTVMDGLVVGAGMEMATFEEIAIMGDLTSATSYGVSAAYTMDALSAGVALASLTYEDAPDFAEVSTVAVNVNYAVNDMITAFAAMKTVLDAGDADMADVICYEAGAKASIDSVTYTAGYTLGSDYEAYCANYTDDDGERAGNFFVKVGASF